MGRWLFTILSIAASPVLAATSYYVSPSGSHFPPFNSMATAATNIQSAVDLASEGDAVVIDDGHYFLSSEITVIHGIKLVGMNGPSDAIIDGGGIVRCFNLANVECMVSGLTITNGWTSGLGGGIYCAGPFPVVTNCVVVGNQALSGGGIYDGAAYDSLLSENTASYEGGGLSEVVAHNCNVLGNTAEYAGGMIYCEAHKCRIVGNHASGESGGVESSSLINCLISGNSADGNGGGAGFGSDLYNCTVVGNSSGGGGGGVNYCAIFNSIIYSNVASLGENDIYDPDKTKYCCSPDAPNGVDGNIDSAPVFVNTVAGNYRLQSSSPCINAGINTYVSSATDLDGNVRIVDGTVDMGAYEYQTDGDGDGMNDQWEIDYFGSTNSSPTSYAGDTDIFNNLQEYIAGTDPTNALSYFMIANNQPDIASGGFIIQWTSVSNRVYAVSWTNALSGAFQSLETGIDYPRNSYTDTVHGSESTGFYRLDVQLKQ